MADDELSTALQRLVNDGVLDDAQVARVDAEVRPLLDEDDDGERLVDVLAYLGGALVLAAVGVIAAMSWDSLGPSGQVLLCVGGAVVLLVAAVLLETRRTNRLPSVLAALASGAAGLAASVAASWIRDDTIDGVNILYAAIGVAIVSVPAYVRWRGWPLVIATYSAGLLYVLYLLDLVDLDDRWGPVVLLTIYGFVFVGLGWLIPERNVAVTLGYAAIALAATIGAVSDETAWVGLILAVIVIAATFGLYAQTRFGGYATLGALTALVVPATAMATLTESALLVAGSLCLIGLSLIVAAVRTNRRTTAT